MIKRILLALDPSNYSKTAVEYACAFSQYHGSELTGMVVLDVPGIAEAVGPVPLGASHYAKVLSETKKKEAEDRISELLNEFRNITARRGIPHRETKVQGVPSRSIIQESIYYDMVILGLRNYFHFETSEKYSNSITKILDRSIPPILGVPECPTPELYDHQYNVLFAFDGSPASARTMHAIAAMSEHEPDRLVVLSSNIDEEASMYRLQEAELFFHAHDINNVELIHTEEPIIKAVDRLAQEDIDFIALGAHAKRGLFDFSWGSLAKHLINKEEKPLLLGH